MYSKFIKKLIALCQAKKLILTEVGRTGQNEEYPLFAVTNQITKIRLFEATTDFVHGFTLLPTKADFRIRNGGRLITDFVRGLKPTPFLIMEHKK